MRSTFSLTARIEGASAGKLLSWTVDESATRNFKGAPSANVSKIKRTIEWIHVSGLGAVARVVINIEPTAKYYDYFVMYKIDSEWKIGVKAFANPDRK